MSLTNIDLQSNSAFCEKRELSLLAPASSTSIIPKREFILVRVARHHFTRPTTNSNLAADGQHTLTAFLAL